MFRILAIILTVTISFAKKMPDSLDRGISKETAGFIRISPQEWTKMGYRGIETKMTDAVIDDSGSIHIIVDKYYSGQKHVWYYLRYNSEGNKLFKKIIYSGEYMTTLHSFLGARLLINPDMTILVFYPDTSFHTCWVKLDRDGKIIERHRAEWWSGGVGELCSAGQDSFHIVTFPVGFRTIIKQYHPKFGEIPLIINPVLIPEFFYSNNFSLKKLVPLSGHYRRIGVSRMILLPDKRVFCFSRHGPSKGYGVGWFLDSNGKSCDGEEFALKDLDKICFAKVSIDTLISRLSEEGEIVSLKWTGLALLPDSTVGVAFWRMDGIYLVKYDLKGMIVESGKGSGKLTTLRELNKKKVSPFISQMGKTIFYWGFDDAGNFFLQVY